MKNLKPQPYKTVLTIGAGFLIIYLITQKQWLLWVVLCLSVISLISPLAARKIETAWMQLGRLLSYIVPPIILSIIFFCFLYPIALLSRIFSEKDPLSLKNKKESMFSEVTSQPNKSSFHKTW